MTAFTLDATSLAFAAHVRDLAERRLKPIADAGSHDDINRDLIRALGDEGLLALLYPGTGDVAAGTALRLCLMRENLAVVTCAAETALALQGLGGHPILTAGSPAVAERWRDDLVAGLAVPAFALTEPGAGSDAGALSLSAVADGPGWRLHGEKIWISNAPAADVYTVFARTGQGITAFVVPGDADGLSGSPLELLAPHPVGRLVFGGVYVGPEDVLGEVGRGFATAMRTLDLYRPSVGAFAVGMGQAAINVTLDHTNSRKAFGGRLRDLQAVSHSIAEMATRLEAARLLVYSAAARYDSGAPKLEVSRTAAMAKLYATEAAQFIVDTAVQLHGARALERGHLLEYLYREVRAPRIYEGASEVQRTIISNSLW